MSDAFRQSGSDKIHHALKPDAQKTWTEAKKDQIVGSADQAASHAQPQHDKSTSQKIIDGVTPDNSSHAHSGDHGRLSMGDKVTAAVTPDAQKPATTQAKDNALGHTDDAIGEATPHENKSVLQKVKDAINPHSSA